MPVPPQAFGLGQELVFLLRVELWPFKSFYKTCTLNDSIPFHRWYLIIKNTCAYDMPSNMWCFAFLYSRITLFFYFNSKGFVRIYSLGIHHDPSQQKIQHDPTILFMEDILHHLGCTSPVNDGKKTTYQLMQGFSHQQYPRYPLGIPCLSLRRLGAVEDPTSGLSCARRPESIQVG